jgi:hypothetical protein
MVSNAIGKPVQGEDFFDRVREVKYIWDRLDTDNVLLLAPRRVGKTSLMYRLRDGARKRGFSAAYLSVSDITTELAFVQKLYAAAQSIDPARRAVLRLAKGPLDQFFKRIKKLGVMSVSVELADTAQEQWGQLGEALTQALDKLEGRRLLLIDELPIFVLQLQRQDPSGDRVRTFLNWFRQLRLDPLGSERTRWLLAGSIGLDTVTRRMRLGDTINDLYLFSDLGAFTSKVAHDFLDELADTYGLRLSASVRERIQTRTGWLIPYHLQLLFAGLREHCSDNNVPATVDAVEAAYRALLAPAKKAYFDYWAQRLEEELGHPDDRQAIALLNVIAEDLKGASIHSLAGVLGKYISEPEKRDEKLHYLLDVLRSDGYLVLESDRFIFRSQLLREFWVRRTSP